MIRLAAEAGADAVKFQSFTAKTLQSKMNWNGDQPIPSPQFDALAQVELDDTWLETLAERANRYGVDFLSTPFSEEAADRLVQLGVPAFKVASGDLTHLPLLEHLGRVGLPIILSTGFSYLAEVEEALKVIHNAGCNDVALLHCVGNYPPEFGELNLNAIKTLAIAFERPVGLSDHSPGSVAPLAAYALGARIIEKHLTSDRRRPGPDHPYALEPDEFANLVKGLRNLEAAMGNGRKVPQVTEEGAINWGRRALYTAQVINEGTVITRDQIKVVRPALSGLPPRDLSRVLGRTTRRKLPADYPLDLNDL